MKAPGSVATVVGLALIAPPGRAHRLDVYLQASTIDLADRRVTVTLRLTAGVEVFRAVRASLDGDGVVSAAEQRAYAERVRRDLALSVDGERLTLRLEEVSCPPLGLLAEGSHAIVLGFAAEVAPGGPTRRLVFKNHHASRIAVYLANCLVPRDPGASHHGAAAQPQSIYLSRRVYAIVAAVTGTARRLDMVGSGENLG